MSYTLSRKLLNTCRWRGYAWYVAKIVVCYTCTVLVPTNWICGSDEGIIVMDHPVSICLVIFTNMYIIILFMSWTANTLFAKIILGQVCIN